MRKYEIIRSAPYCCVCAVLESVIKRHGYNITQFDIANYIGLVCPSSDKDVISKKIHNIHISDDAKDWGVHLGRDTINNLFRHYKIPLQEIFFSGNQFDEINLDSFFDAVSDSYDIMLFISHGILYDIKQNFDVGHCILYVSRSGNKIEYLDPGPTNLGLNNKDLYDIFLSIKKREQIGGGLSIIKSIL